MTTNLTTYSQQLPATLTASVIPQNYANPGFSIQQILSILRAYRKKILLIAGSLSVVISIGVLALPKSYEATATLLINYEVNDPLAGKEFPVALLGNYTSTQIELIQSPVVLLPVIDKLGLTHDPNYIKGFHGDPANLAEWIEGIIWKNLTVEQGRLGSELIYVNYTDGSADNAMRLANAIADVYTDQHVQRLSDPASDRAQRYTEQLDELKKKVDAAQDQLTQFRQRTGLIASTPGSEVDLNQLTALQKRLLEVQNDRRTSETQTDSTFTPQVLSSTLIQSLKTQAAEQEARLAELRATLGPRHPEILELQSQLDATRRSIAGEMKTYSNGANSDLKANSQLEKKLQTALDDERSKVLSGRKLQDEAAKYQLELESAQTVYKRALDGYDQVMFATNAHYSNVSIVSRAVRPLIATKPKTAKLLAMGIFASVMIALGGTLIYELFNRRVRCRDDLEREYGIPVLAEFRFASKRQSTT